mmetsp:Transcript_66654/g.168880  ORF Transcript_66654/g.168880 Transcript_66654/m.168880 type:complete len:253 (-) Transcript_66654:430-1188(-)
MANYCFCSNQDSRRHKCVPLFGGDERGEAEAALLPVEGGVVVAQHGLAERVDSLEGGLLQRQGAQLRRAVFAGVVRSPQRQHHVSEVELQVGAQALLAQHEALREGRLHLGQAACLHAEARGAGVDDAMAAALAAVDQLAAHVNGLDGDLPIAVLGVVHREPLQRRREPGGVVAAEVNLTALCSEQDAKLRENVPGALQEALHEAAHGAHGQAGEAQADDAVVGHGAEGGVVHLRGRQHGQVDARAPGGLSC